MESFKKILTPKSKAEIDENFRNATLGDIVRVWNNPKFFKDRQMPLIIEAFKLLRLKPNLFNIDSINVLHETKKRMDVYGDEYTQQYEVGIGFSVMIRTASVIVMVIKQFNDLYQIESMEVNYLTHNKDEIKKKFYNIKEFQRFLKKKYKI